MKTQRPLAILGVLRIIASSITLVYGGNLLMLLSTTGGTGKIYVKDMAGTPLADADVDIYQISYMGSTFAFNIALGPTESDGLASFSTSLGDATYYFKVSKSGYQQKTSSIYIPVGGSTTKTVKLEETVTSLEGTWYIENTPITSENQEIRLSSTTINVQYVVSQGTATQAVVSWSGTSTGSAALTNVAEGVWEKQITLSEGTYDLDFSVTDTTGQTQTLSISLQSGTTTAETINPITAISATTFLIGAVLIGYDYKKTPYKIPILS